MLRRFLRLGALPWTLTMIAKTQKGRAPEPRLSRTNSRKFAELVRRTMADCRLPSLYALFLSTNAETSRASIHRWMRGTVRIPVSAARELVDGLAEYSSRIQRSHLLAELDAIVRGATDEHPQTERLRAELRARGVPVQRALEAFRAVNLIPNEQYDAKQQGG